MVEPPTGMTHGQALVAYWIGMNNLATILLAEVSQLKGIDRLSRPSGNVENQRAVIRQRPSFVGAVSSA